MSDQLAAEIYERLTAGLVKVPQSIFHRGWNAAIEFAIKQMRLACDEPAEKVTEAAE